MPNTNPPILDKDVLGSALDLAEKKAHCDFGVYLGGAEDNAQEVAALAEKAAGLKLYLNNTYGPLLLEDLSSWIRHIECWPSSWPLAAHAEGKTMAALLTLVHLYNRPVHICHVSRKDEITLIRKAKAIGVQVTCEVTPHHLFLNEKDLSGGRATVSPPLASAEDQQALWDNLDVIDCIACDHAPHTPEEKDSGTPPPGFPGLETTLPLLLSAVHEGRLEIEDIVKKMYTNPKQIFSIPDQKDTWVEVDEDHSYEIRGSDQFTKAGWTPFEGRLVKGLVRQVTIRGKTGYQDGEVLAEKGFGRNIREIGSTH
jgi:carbamoyl-phosphate synthase/aspartate carbamoyltransferase/dihydroorotase